MNPGRFLLSGVFSALLLSACSYRELSSFPFTPGTGEGGRLLYGLSKNAAAGILPPRENRPLEYAFDAPFVVPPGVSLEISYELNEDGEASAFVLEAGSLSWELPPNLSSVGLAFARGEGDLIRYAVPLSEGDVIKGIRILRDGAQKGSAPGLKVLGMRVTDRWYGFSLDEGPALSLSPFVYGSSGLNGGGEAVSIDPPRRFAGEGIKALTAGAAGGGIRVEALSRGAGGFSLEADPSLTRLSVPGGLFDTAALSFSVSGSALHEARLIPARAGEAEDGSPPPLADPGIVLSWPYESWREKGYTVFRWDAFPQLLLFDTANYAVQDRLFKRLAFFTEKKGFRGRLAGDGEIADLHGWNAHDYRAESLAAFFQAAEESAFPLSGEELELQSLLLQNGVIERRAGGIVPGRGAVVSVSRESQDYLRYRFMAHECFHGIYFIDADFREFSRRRWEGLSDAARRFIVSYFDFQAYDTGDTDLVINEFMAHVLQQPESQAGLYFGSGLPSRMVSRSPWRRDALPGGEEAGQDGTRHWPVLAEAFSAEARAFSRYAEQRWGLAAGRVWKVRVGNGL
jgi:hypothetical protein